MTEDIIFVYQVVLTLYNDMLNVLYCIGFSPNNPITREDRNEGRSPSKLADRRAPAEC